MLTKDKSKTVELATYLLSEFGERFLSRYGPAQVGFGCPVTSAPFMTKPVSLRLTREFGYAGEFGYVPVSSATLASSVRIG